MGVVGVAGRDEGRGGRRGGGVGGSGGGGAEEEEEEVEGEGGEGGGVTEESCVGVGEGAGMAFIIAGWTKGAQGATPTGDALATSTGQQRHDTHVNQTTAGNRTRQHTSATLGGTQCSSMHPAIGALGR